MAWQGPHNLGAIVRTSLAAGAHGVVIGTAGGGIDGYGFAGVGGGVGAFAGGEDYESGAEHGGVEKAGYWLIGLDEKAEKNYTEAGLYGGGGDCFGRRGGWIA